MQNGSYIVYVVVLFISFSFGCGPEEVINEEGNYRDGKKDGKWISYCIHDQKIEEGNYIDGKKDGKWFDFKVRKENDEIVAYNTLKFPVGGILRHFPKLFSKVVDFKLARMWEEDKEILESRGKVGLDSNDKCLPDSNVLSDHLMANLDNISDLPNHFKNGEGKYTYQYF